MRATYSPSIFGTHHIFSRQGLSSFSARRRRTVSRETLSCSVRRTISPASSSMVQRARPSGGWAHAVATRSASSWPVSLRLAPGRGSSPGQSHMARREGYASLAPSARSRFPPQKLCQYFPDGIILRWNYSSAIALGLLRESLLKITLHEAALGPVDRRAAHAEALGHRLVRDPGIGRKQDLGALELAGRMPPTADQGLELDTLGFA